MADSPPYRDTGDETGAGPDPGPTTGAPRWVKVFGLIAVVLILLVAVLLLVGGGSHGPGRHASSGDADGRTPPSSVESSGAGGGHQVPSGGHAP